MAISTDCNPGSSPCTSLLLMLNMACTLFRLTPEEALAGVTRHAAAALGLRDRGVLAEPACGPILCCGACSGRRS
jgi:imidazolonepropionase